jgi:thiamine biosynthesis lipoprotein
MGAEHDTSFRSMGCDVRLLIDTPGRRSQPPASVAANRERAFIRSFAARLSRFDACSEVHALNADLRSEVPASPLVRTAVAAGLWAADRTGGLVDPTLVPALERAGYAQSREGATPASLEEALAQAPQRRPAEAHPDAAWRSIQIDHAAGTVTRPPGLRIDTGGTGKGLAADAVARRLGGYGRFAIDCGGDIAVGGPAALANPYVIDVQHPLTGEVVHRLRVRSGGVATSGIDRRVWQRADGSFAHHLIDPSTGVPAWTGLIAATALAPSALEAETYAKQALLSGPGEAPAVLARMGGGVLVHDSGDVQVVEANAATRRLKLTLAA